MGIAKASHFKNAYSKLRLGMSKEEVLNMLGDPNSLKVRSGIEIYTWWNREFKGLLRGGTIERRIIVEFDKDIVCGYDGENIDASVL